jgi:hypothetical protein
MRDQKNKILRYNGLSGQILDTGSSDYDGNNNNHMWNSESGFCRTDD